MQAWRERIVRFMDANPHERCLILGYDRTDAARLALSWAAHELAPRGRLVIVHACRPLHAPPLPLASAGERRRLARAEFDELLLEDGDSLLDLDIQTEISDEDPVTALVQAASRHHARGIVVGCEPHSRLHRALGTVTSELMQSSPVPVTVVPCRAE